MLIRIHDVKNLTFTFFFGTMTSVFGVLHAANVCRAEKWLSTDILRARYCRLLRYVMPSEEKTMSPQMVEDPQLQSWGRANLSVCVEVAVCPKSSMKEGCSGGKSKQQARRPHLEPSERRLTV